MRQIILILVLTVAGIACRAETAKSPEGGGATPPPAVASVAPVPAAAAATGAQADPGCGRRAGDWCAAPAGDPCGAHKNVQSCRADARCTGMKFRGEGPECKIDDRGFGIGCPTVGCISQ
jgi:hypothetical protein